MQPKLPQDVQVGQLYKDNDRRSGDRIVRVIYLYNPLAAQVENTETGRKTKIKRERLVGTGKRSYTYIGKSK